MKKLHLYLFFGALFLVSTQGFCQITINKSDMPANGDTVRISTGLNVDFIDVTKTGADYTWDYSGLVPFTQRIDTFINANQTPPPAGIFFNFIADFASRLVGNLPFPGVQVSDPYQFFKSTDGAFKMVGFSLSMQGFGIPAVFSSPDILYKFPLEYGNVDSSFSGTDMNIPETGYIKIDRKRKNSVDGWGTLITPYGTFETVRVKSEVTEYDSIYLSSQETGIGIPYSYTEYKWLGKDQKAPLLTVKDVIAGLIVEYPDYKRGSLSIIENENQQHNLSIFPNPVKDVATVSFTIESASPVSIAVFDITGKKILEVSKQHCLKGENQISINFQNHEIVPGNYIITLNTLSQKSASTIIYQPE